ncbi:M48 family metallopeptidase [Terriglobus sp.]|uniref:M48 family metallopeptidase n=1 Tax=Terriglobus sp. TaxID=1889013 RepID=UPI003B00E32B
MQLRNLALIATLCVTTAGFAGAQITTPTTPTSTTGTGGVPGTQQDPAKVPNSGPTNGPPPTASKADLDKARDEANKNNNEPIPDPGDDLKKNIKKGSEEDVNAAGTRDIGGRGMGNWFSTDWEVRNGKQYAMEVERSSKMITDPVVVEYINRIGQNIVKNSDAKVPFTIKVIDSDEINAMALPGGYFYVNSGLVLAADNESELAGVMAHEIAHVAAHHAARQMTRAQYMQLSTVPLIFMGGYTAYGIYEASQLAIPLGFLKFSRGFEAEADWLGVQYAYRSGYDPQGLVTMFEKLDALEKRKPGVLARAFSDHPQTPDRIERSEQEIATILPAKQDYLVTTSEFDNVKARLARIQNKRKIDDKKDPNKPTLRRTSASNNDPNSSNGSQQDKSDDRPTLGRRD